MKVTNIELPDVEYILTCTKTTNPIAKDKKAKGTLWSTIIKVGFGISFNDRYKGWYTSSVQEINLKKDGSIVCKTLNSTYILKEVTDETEILS